MWCKCCLTEKPSGEFLDLGRKYRVTYCNDCARSKMAAWEAARRSIKTHGEAIAGASKETA